MNFLNIYLIQKDDKLNNESENFDNKDPKVITNPISFYNLSSEAINAS